MAKVLQITRSSEPEISLKIGDLAKRAGKSTRALRLYEDLGLLGPTIRSEGGHRLYATEALVRLHWIDKLQLLGFSLHDIKSFLDHLHDDRLGPVAMERVRQTFASKLDQVRAQIASLQILADELGDSLEYLHTCKTCDTTASLDACPSCDHDHSIEPPVLITGIYKG
jgi:MerR family transcriptional regulator, copper efflux regulator